MEFISDYQLWRKEAKGPIVSIAKKGSKFGKVELDLILSDYRIDDHAAEEIESLFAQLSNEPIAERYVYCGNKVMHVGHTVCFHNRIPKERELEAAQALWDIAIKFLERRKGSPSDYEAQAIHNR